MFICRCPISATELANTFLRKRTLSIIIPVFASVFLTALLPVIIMLSFFISGFRDTSVFGLFFLALIIITIIIVTRLNKRNRDRFVIFAADMANNVFCIDAAVLLNRNILFSGQRSGFSATERFAAFSAWSEVSARMKRFDAEHNFDDYIASPAVINAGYAVTAVDTFKENSRCYTARVALRRANSPNGSCIMRKIRIPKSFENSDMIAGIISCLPSVRR